MLAIVYAATLPSTHASHGTTNILRQHSPSLDTGASATEPDTTEFAEDKADPTEDTSPNNIDMNDSEERGIFKSDDENPNPGQDSSVSALQSHTIRAHGSEGSKANKGKGRRERQSSGSKWKKDMGKERRKVRKQRQVGKSDNDDGEERKRKGKKGGKRHNGRRGRGKKGGMRNKGRHGRGEKGESRNKGKRRRGKKGASRSKGMRGRGKKGGRRHNGKRRRGEKGESRNKGKRGRGKKGASRSKGKRGRGKGGRRHNGRRGRGEKGESRNKGRRGRGKKGGSQNKDKRGKYNRQNEKSPRDGTTLSGQSDTSDAPPSMTAECPCARVPVSSGVCYDITDRKTMACKERRCDVKYECVTSETARQILSSNQLQLSYASRKESTTALCRLKKVSTRIINNKVRSGYCNEESTETWTYYPYIANIAS